MIEMCDLTVTTGDGSRIPILRSLHLDVPDGTRVGVVGESGSGKSTLLRVLAGNPGRGLVVSAGSAVVAGTNLLAMPEAERRALLGPLVALVPQAVGQSLTPHLDVGAHFRDVFQLAGLKDDPRELAVPLLDEVGLAGSTLIGRFPHELSGGEQQRVLIALGLARDPAVLLLDEPTSALDVGISHDILSMIEQEQRDRGFTLVCVSHDLGVIERIAELVVVMTKGEIVEQGDRADVIGRPAHPYTQRLLGAVPQIPDHGAEHVEVSGAPLVEARALRVVRSGARAGRGFGRTRRTTTALDEVTFTVRAGEILGIIGESGSGKSTFLKTVCGLIQVTGGELTMAGGIDLSVPTARRDATVLGRMQMVFQNPDDSLNPAHSVWRILAPGRRGRAVPESTLVALLEQVGLDGSFLSRRSSQLSGGEKQRVAIARALALKPELLLLDEVTSALDVTVQAEVLDTLRRVHRRLGTTMVLVCHDLAVVASIADRVAVLRGGRLLEIATTAAVLDHPSDPYTAQLVAVARRSA